MLERSLPLWRKTILPVDSLGGVAGGEKYCCQGILIKFACDDQGIYGGDEGASKVGGHELKSASHFYDATTAPIRRGQGGARERDREGEGVREHRGGDGGDSGSGRSGIQISGGGDGGDGDGDGLPRAPLILLIDYLGFRLTAIPLLPVHARSLLYGSSDAGKRIYWCVGWEEMGLHMKDMVTFSVCV